MDDRDGNGVVTAGVMSDPLIVRVTVRSFGMSNSIRKSTMLGGGWLLHSGRRLRGRRLSGWTAGGGAWTEAGGGPCDGVCPPPKPRPWPSLSCPNALIEIMHKTATSVITRFIVALSSGLFGEMPNRARLLDSKPSAI